MKILRDASQSIASTAFVIRSSDRGEVETRARRAYIIFSGAVVLCFLAWMLLSLSGLKLSSEQESASQDHIIHLVEEVCATIKSVNLERQFLIPNFSISLNSIDNHASSQNLRPFKPLLRPRQTRMVQRDHRVLHQSKFYGCIAKLQLRVG